MTAATLTDTLPRVVGDYTLDPAHTRIGFVARHAMVTKVRGAFNAFEGIAHIDNDVSMSWTKLSIDVDSIDTRNAIRDGQLRGGDFLDTDNHPEITFESTTVRLLGAQTAEVTGDLTIKGVTRQVTIPFEFQGTATDPYGDHRVGFEGSIVVNRRDWGITWNAALETGGVLVSDRVTLELDVSAIKNA
jgi:polyisoprenoid-binding protein YceI